MIEFQSVSKAFGDVHANQSVQFACAKGRIHGLLGVNGAGKSTALNMLAGLAKPDSGKITVDGLCVTEQLKRVQTKMGIFLGNEGLYPKLTAFENVQLFADIHGVANPTDKTHHRLSQLGIEHLAKRRVEGFSTGEKMKVSLARALVHEPDYVILDEPTRGLDVMSIRLLREILQSERDRGCCVLFSSHVMQEVSALCDDITVIHQGCIRFVGSIEDIQAHTQQTCLEEAFVQLISEHAHIASH